MYAPDVNYLRTDVILQALNHIQANGSIQHKLYIGI